MINSATIIGNPIVPLITVLLSVYKGEDFLEGYLENFLLQSWAKKTELVIIHNDPLQTELKIISRYKDKIKIIHLQRARESMYSSLNAGILASKGKYITTWNVDDLRTPKSLEILAIALECNALIGWSYGDFGITRQYGGEVSEYINPPQWSRKHGTSGSIGGPFFMFRRSLLDEVGFFDEQFYSGGDFDYTVRLSMVSQGVKVDGFLGYFLNEKKGLSTAGNLQAIERTVIQIRYRIWNGFDLSKLDEAFKYEVDNILNHGNWIRLQNLMPNLPVFLHGRKLSLRNSLLYSTKEFLRKIIKN